MKHLSGVEGFEWDAGNEQKSVSKHNVSSIEAEQVFFNMPLLVLDDLKHSDKEPRFHAMGYTDEKRFLHISFTIRGKKVRVISARDMHRKERDVYEKGT